MTYKRIIASLLSFIFLLTAGAGCSVSDKKEEYNQTIQSWLEENIQNAEDYKLSLSLTTSYAQYDQERPANIPENYNADYEIHVFKPERKVKITVNEPELNEQGLAKMTEKTFYLSIEEDRVILYKGTDMGGSKEIYQNAQLAEAVRAIVFPDDMGIFNGQVVLSGISEDGMKTLGVQRAVAGEPFYRPIYILTGERREAGKLLSFNFNYDTVSKRMFNLSIPQVEDWYRAIYYILNKSPYENIYTQNNFKYDQQLNVYFNEMGKAEDFELPEDYSTAIEKNLPNALYSESNNISKSSIEQKTDILLRDAHEDIKKNIPDIEQYVEVKPGNLSHIKDGLTGGFTDKEKSYELTMRYFELYKSPPVGSTVPIVLVKKDYSEMIVAYKLQGGDNVIKSSLKKDGRWIDTERTAKGKEILDIDSIQVSIVQQD